ncbi:MAG TPA: hemerythrin domain-containing protein [Candidatus Tectomicrobia bacterium]
MTAELTELAAPIDVMYLIHKALRAKAACVKEIVHQLEEGSSLQPFRRAFYQWVMALEYHSAMEEAYITALSSDASPSWDHEAVHAAMEAKLEEVQTCLNEEIGRTFLIARTQRHLFGKVLEAAITQEDHLEDEEAFLLPILRQRVAERQQLEVAKRLLIDQESEDSCWMLDWLSQHLTVKEQQCVTGLLARLTAVVP